MDSSGEMRTSDSVRAPEEDNWREVRAALLAKIEMPLYGYPWAVVCALVGSASLIYGAHEAVDDIFLSSFVWWAMIPLPIFVSIMGRLVLLAFYFKKITITAIVAVALFASAVVLSRSSVSINMAPSFEKVRPLLTDSVFVRLAAILLLTFVLLSFLTVAGVVLLRFLKGYFELNHTDSQGERDIALNTSENTKAIEMARIDLDKEIQLKKLEIEHEQVRLRVLKLEAEHREAHLLTAERAPSTDQQPHAGQESNG